MNEESFGGMVMPMRNPPEECLFRQKLPAQRLGIHRILPEITSSKTRNSREEWDSVGNNQLLKADADSNIIMREKSSNL
jgi:hypothetical protein